MTLLVPNNFQRLRYIPLVTDYTVFNFSILQKYDDLRQDEKPLQINVKEEVPIGTVLGSVEAIDLDEKQNAEIGYLIIGKTLKTASRIN